MALAVGKGRPQGAGAPGRRVSSGGAYSAFDQAQVAQFRETFALIDQDSDGLISENDLKQTLQSLGKKIPASLQAYFERSKTINFALFLTLFSEQLLRLDSEDDLLEAFETLDADDDGTLDAEELRDLLQTEGQPLSKAEVDALLEGPFTTRQGRFKYREWIASLRVLSDAETGKTAA